MGKDFDSWNEQKKHTHAHGHAPYYREREVRWCELGVNIGFEQDGTGQKYSRPVLILKAFNRHVCLVVPLTKAKKNNPYHVPAGTVGDREASAIISQVRLIDTKRLDQRIAILKQNIFDEIKNSVRNYL